MWKMWSAVNTFFVLSYIVTFVGNVVSLLFIIKTNFGTFPLPVFPGETLRYRRQDLQRGCLRLRTSCGVCGRLAGSWSGMWRILFSGGQSEASWNTEAVEANVSRLRNISTTVSTKKAFSFLSFIVLSYIVTFVGNVVSLLFIIKTNFVTFPLPAFPGETLRYRMCVIMGRDWNCTTNFVLDINGEEPHSQSSKMLLKITQELELIDVWRNINQLIKQYTWVKILDSTVTRARLDRIYVNKSDNNRVMNVGISPCGFSDHHVVTIDFNTTRVLHPKSYWHFNVKLLYDKFFFCENV